MTRLYVPTALNPECHIFNQENELASCGYGLGFPDVASQPHHIKQTPSKMTSPFRECLKETVYHTYLELISPSTNLGLARKASLTKGHCHSYRCSSP